MEKEKKNKQFLESLDEISIEMIYSNFQLSKEILEEQGYNLEKIESKGEKFIRKLKFLSEANVNLGKHENLLEQAFKLLQQKITENASLAGEILTAHLKRVNPAVQYRKLEEWTDEEVREVLNETDIIKLIEELDDAEGH